MRGTEWVLFHIDGTGAFSHRCLERPRSGGDV